MRHNTKIVKVTAVCCPEQANIEMPDFLLANSQFRPVTILELAFEMQEVKSTGIVQVTFPVL